MWPSGDDSTTLSGDNSTTLGGDNSALQCNDSVELNCDLEFENDWNTFNTSKDEMTEAFYETESDTEILF